MTAGAGAAPAESLAAGFAAVLEYARTAAAERAASDRQRAAFELAIARTASGRDPAKLYPPVHLPLVHAGIHGEGEPAVPVAVVALLVAVGADLYDDLADGDLPAEWEERPPFEVAFTADALSCVLPQAVLAGLAVAAGRRCAMSRLGQAP